MLLVMILLSFRKPIGLFLCLTSLLLTNPSVRADPPCHFSAGLNEQISQPDHDHHTDIASWQELHQELYLLLARSSGCSLNFVFLPWSRALQQLQSGELDLLLTVSKNEERQYFADFIGIHYNEESVLILRRDLSYQVHQVRDLIALEGQIGVMRFGYFGETFERLKSEGLESRLLFVTTLQQKLDLLSHGRVAGIIEDRAQYRAWLKYQPEANKIYEEHLLIHSNPAYFAASISSMSQQQRDHLRQSWAKVYGNAEHRAILATYGWSLDSD
jgi:polar amino acid transport system substrate-binding protein